MLAILADENFDGRLLLGLRRRCPLADIVRVQEVGLISADDPTVLAWAAARGRVVISHDVATLVDFAWERVLAGLPLPGLIKVANGGSIREIVEQLAYMIEEASPEEIANNVWYIPV